jgi:small-conductance mechanosensitive channel
MNLALGLVATVVLLLLRRLSQRLKLSNLPIRISITAAIAIPLLAHVGELQYDVSQSLTAKNIATAITLLWTISCIKLGSWAILEVPADLGWWRPTAKILRDLIDLAIITAITLVIVHRDYNINLVGIAATSAVLTAIVGLAAQETLKNLFAGLSLQLESPFHEGDWIDLGNTRGVVSSLQLMTTRIRTMEGALVIVPNSRIAAEGVLRFTAGENVGQVIEVGLDYGFPPRQAIELIESVVSKHKLVLNTPPPEIMVHSYAESAVSYEIRIYQASAPEMEELRSDLLEQIWYALQRIGQSIPYPVRVDRTTPAPVLLPSNAMDDIVIEDAIKSIDLFQNLNRIEIKDLAKSALCETFAPGELLIHQGETGKGLFIVIRGELLVSETMHSGVKKILGKLHEKDVFGEMSLCTGASHSADIRCTMESVIVTIEKEDLLPIMKTKPQLIEHMGSLMAHRQNKNKHEIDDNSQLDLIKVMKQFFGISNDLG